MNTPQDGGPAFPAIEYETTPGTFKAGGMTLRDWFAGQALTHYASEYQDRMVAKDIASQCYSLADAMLEARKAKP